MRYEVPILILIAMIALSGIVGIVGTMAVNQNINPDIEHVNYIHYGDTVIFPESVKGLSIRKYMVASTAPGQHFEYVLQIHGTDQGITFETREEATTVMIEIAEACGI